MTIRTLIVDDEPLARQRLCSFLEREADIEIVGECADGAEAVAGIRQHQPDLVFLDVQMPELDGFGVLRALDEPLPLVVFVTAYDRYALQAFDVHAIDYLLKPFTRQRLQKSLDRVRAALRQDAGTEMKNQVRGLLQEGQGRRPPDRLAIKSGEGVSLLKMAEIDWIEAAGNYLQIHVGDRKHLLRDTLSGLETRLDPDRFVRIHRSTIVNVERIQQLQPWFHGDFRVILQDGTQLMLSRTYRSRLQERLGNRF